SLSNNQLTNSIPTDIGLLTNLVSLPLTAVVLCLVTSCFSWEVFSSFPAPHSCTPSV
ncbi:unnamed protein product, partial [Closterium sp. Naga37s-1]